MAHTPQQIPNLPVFKLIPELLCRIFDMNGGMFTDNDALDNTRRSSQVCREWREILLDYHLIWSRLIDLDNFFHQKVDKKWIDLILERSGSAPLWMKSFYAEQTVDNVAFTFSLVDTYWERLEYLYLDVQGVHDSYTNPYTTIYRPAPFLRHIHIKNDAPFPLPAGDTPILLGDHAPRLTSFFIDEIIINGQETWLRGIKNLDITLMGRLSDLLQILQKTRELESLQFEPGKFDFEGKPIVMSGSLSRVFLPRLETLAICAKLENAMKVIDHLHVPNISYIRIDIVDTDPENNVSPSTLQPLVNLPGEYLASHELEMLEISLPYSRSFELRFYRDGWVVFEISLVFWRCSESVRNMHVLLIEAFTSIKALASVTQLSIDYRQDPGMESLLVLPLYTFVSSLTGVEVLKIEVQNFIILFTAFTYYRELESIYSPSIQFPSLSTIRMLHVANTDDFKFSAPLIVKLLASLRLSGLKILYLDIGKWEEEGSKRPPVELLDSLIGTTVKWQDPVSKDTLEYRCGSRSLPGMFLGLTMK